MLRVIIYQGLITTAIASVFISLGSANILSSFVGGLIAIANTLLLARSVNKAGFAASEQEKARGTLVLVKSIVLRFVLVLLSFYIAIVQFNLDALQLLISFSLAQLGYVFYKSKTIY
ncbi:MAG: hypothetical protein CMD43_01495 [Gammaproteobacteria bacterium]|nr:hypothetical protein [Gammaproteobacteria bacterium]